MPCGFTEARRSYSAAPPLPDPRADFSAEARMKRRTIAMLVLLIAPVFARAQTEPGLPAAPELKYEFVSNFFKLPPHLYFGEMPSVAVNSKGHIFAYSRGGHTQLFEFGPTGEF